MFHCPSQYLIPVCKGLLGSPSDPLNYVFRIIIPIGTAGAACITLWALPIETTTVMEHSEGFDFTSDPISGLWRTGQAGAPPMGPGVTRVLVNPVGAALS